LGGFFAAGALGHFGSELEGGGDSVGFWEINQEFFESLPSPMFPPILFRLTPVKGSNGLIE
jgi:hypothetical protein